MADSRQAEDRETAAVRRERDLYLRLLELGSEQQLEPFLKEALALVTEAAGAHQGYLEIQDPGLDEPREQWSAAEGLSEPEVEGVRDRISRGILAEALSTGRSIATASAVSDPRFSEFASVQKSRIEAVLCAPIGAEVPIGALYLQGRDAPGPFTEADQARAELFARHVAPIADRLLQRRRIRRDTDPTRPYRQTLQVEGVSGRSDALARLLHDVSLVAPLDVSVLLTGESGTGKSQIAHVIHANGPRAGRPLVEVNCSALPENLVESELFGAEAGAHSTATRRTRGKVHAAEGGTLFLDEVGELPGPAQSSLLQLLQSKQYFPLGSTQEARADVRIIAATNANLEERVREGRFREDLLYRLQVLPIRVPSLAERASDIAELAEFFCAEVCHRHGLAPRRLSQNALRAAATTAWPGNVRQLANAIEAAVIRASGADEPEVRTHHLFPDRESSESDVVSEPHSFQQATREFQRKLVAGALADAGWDVREAAKRLELTRSHVYNLIRSFGISRDEG